MVSIVLTFRFFGTAKTTCLPEYLPIGLPNVFLIDMVRQQIVYSCVMFMYLNFDELIGMTAHKLLRVYPRVWHVAVEVRTCAWVKFGFVNVWILK